MTKIQLTKNSAVIDNNNFPNASVKINFDKELNDNEILHKLRSQGIPVFECSIKGINGESIQKAEYSLLSALKVKRTELSFTTNLDELTDDFNFEKNEINSLCYKFIASSISLINIDDEVSLTELLILHANSIVDNDKQRVTILENIEDIKPIQSYYKFEVLKITFDEIQDKLNECKLKFDLDSRFGHVIDKAIESLQKKGFYTELINYMKVLYSKHDNSVVFVKKDEVIKQLCKEYRKNTYLKLNVQKFDELFTKIKYIHSEGSNGNPENLALNSEDDLIVNIVSDIENTIIKINDIFFKPLRDEAHAINYFASSNDFILQAHDEIRSLTNFTDIEIEYIEKYRRYQTICGITANVNHSDDETKLEEEKKTLTSWLRANHKNVRDSIK